MKLNKVLPKKADIIVICLFILSASALFALKGTEAAVNAEIYVDTELIKSVRLSGNTEEYTIDLENGVTITVNGSTIAFSDSDCTGKDCVSCGALSHSGDTAVCIPNKTVIRLTGKNRSKIDTISY